MKKRAIALVCLFACSLVVANAQRQTSSKSQLPSDLYGPNAKTEKHSDFHGIYQAMINRVLHKWDFYENGMFLHETIAAGYRTSVRNSERGEFTISGGKITLAVKTQAGGAVTTGSDSTALLTGGQGKKEELRTMTIKLLGAHGDQGIVLDGVQYKVRSWQ